MAITFTPQQQKVIDLHKRNILVSAAAGSGKTAVLVERIIQMICDEKHPVDIDRLLIVTFTNAAAAEMRERILNGISVRLLEQPESEHIQKQATLIHNAQITTIDSFCLFLIRNHFNVIGLDPAFRVADEGELKLLEQEVLGSLLEEKYAGGEEDFRFCVEYFCPGGRESVLEQHILNLSRYSASFPWPEEWLEERKKDYAAEDVEALLGSDYGRYLTEHIRRMVEGCRDKLCQLLELCEQPDGPYMYAELVEQELEQVKRLENCGTLEEYGERIPAVSFGRLPVKKDESVSPLKREQAKNLRNEVKGTLQNLWESFFATPLELVVRQGAECREPLGTLLELVLEFRRRMRAQKQEKKIIDFSDMEHYALEILLERVPKNTEKGELTSTEGSEAEAARGVEGARAETEADNGDITTTEWIVRPSAVAKEYRKYFQEILIDEYQDSNLVQEYLLKAVSGEEDGQFNRFMVGDVKQSIYKFRLARPELFLEKYDTYQEEDSSCQRIDLSKNFRSRTQVVESVNQIFSRLMSRETGGIAYDERAALYAGASYPDNEGCESELLLVEKPKAKGEMTARQAEALALAQRIKMLRTSYRVTDKSSGELRPVRFSDMVILLRTNSGWDEEFKRVLEEEGIPVYIASKTGYFSATEVQELLQLLRVLDNPRQDIPLYGVLHSGFGGFTEEEIALIRSRQKGTTLYEALADYEGEAVLQERISGFLNRVNYYRDCTTYMPIRELLQNIVEDYDYLNYVTALPAGSKRRANVEMLFTKASDFGRTSYFGLFHFIRYIEQLEKYDVDYGEADTLDENADVVRIMSIHKSKGLEFPVTFVAGLSKRFNMQDVNQSLIVDMDLGVGIEYVNPGLRIKNKTLRRSVLSCKMKEDNLAEELRVLYVALTRAREKLIISAAVEKAEEKWEIHRESPAERLSYLDFMGAGSYLDFLLPILEKTDMKVTVTDVEGLLGESFREQIGLMERREELAYAADRVDEEALTQLEQRFSFIYPNRQLEKLFTKTTVSELKIAAMADKDEAAFHAFEEKEVVPYIPEFRREKERVSGAVRGSAFHRVMELLDFEELLGRACGSLQEGKLPEEEFPCDYGTFLKTQNREDIKQYLQEFLEKETADLRLSTEYYEALNQEKVVRFLQSPLAYRMWSAQRRGELYREQPFVLGISAARLGEDFPEQETVLIQGIIDVFFVEEGGLVLLDYKTDVIDSMEDLWNRYATQLDYYEEALARLMSMPVKEKLLYSFYLGEEFGRTSTASSG